MVPDLQGVKVSREETKSTAVEVIEKAIYLIIMFRLLCRGRGYRQDSTGDVPSCLPGVRPQVERVSAELSFSLREPEHGGVI
ncbi:hypothetical protein MACH10_23140 [Thalassospira tepidiphila]|nr:hypothetical protein MACH10_23140 [Thalassospira tepidiphila]